MQKLSAEDREARRVATRARASRVWAERHIDQKRQIARAGSARRREEQPDRIRQSNRKYRESHVEQVRESSRRRHGAPSAWPAALLRQAKVASKSRGHSPPTITVGCLKQLWATQAGQCYWTGLPLSLVVGSPHRVSLERLDNSRGYDSDNVALAVWWINRARSNIPHDTFRDVIQDFTDSVVRRAWATA